MLAGGGLSRFRRRSAVGIRAIVGVRGALAPLALGRVAQLVEEADDDLPLLGRERGGDAEPPCVLPPDGGLGRGSGAGIDQDCEGAAIGRMRRATDVPARFETVEELGGRGARDTEVPG